MSYQVLYRVWRSQKFEDVAGQTAVTQTLKNAIIQGKSSHAYLFSGPRGTGKTSVAKIFAKAINCHHTVDGEPCNECDICRSITAGEQNDVIEIDAASNNGVDEIRDIRDKAKYVPTEADFKVYIIDEVHMLSTGAFNALLKTLEEPPKNVIFILATTEPHKIPATIISRTQRFDFKRISNKDIIGRMTYILDQEKIGYEDQALAIVAKAAEGGMRDALSILDQVISYGDQMVTTENALNVTGSLTEELLIQYLSTILTNDTEQGLSLLEQILAQGKDAARFVEDLILFSRDILVYQKAPKLEEGGMSDAFKALAGQMNAAILYQVIGTLNDIQNEMRYTNHPAIYLEVATVKITQLSVGSQPQTTTPSEPAPMTATSPADSQRVQELEQKLAQMEQQIKQLLQQGTGGARGTAEAKPKSPAKATTASTFKINQTKIFSILKEATKPDLLLLQDAWGDLLDTLSVTQRAIMKASTPVAASPSGLIVSFDYEILCQKATEDAELILTIGNNLSRLIQRSPDMVCVPKEEWPKIRSNFLERHQDELKKNQGSAESGVEAAAEPPAEPDEDPVVAEAVAMFGEDLVEVIEN